MLIIGNYYRGEMRRFYLTENKVNDTEIIREIKEAIISLRSLQDDFVLVDLFDDIKDIYDRPIFFQAYKDRSFGMTNYYIVESGIRTNKGIGNYVQEKVTKENVIKLFEEICLDRKQLDDEWMPTGEKYDDNGKSFNSESNDKERALIIATSYWSEEIDGESAGFACDEAVEILTQLTSDSSYGEALTNIYFQYDDYQKVKSIFGKLSHNPLVALAMGKVEYYGKLGKPNYKKAFEYFQHASNIGSTEANYYIGQMYKFGQHVKKDIQKYIELTQSVYEFYVKNDAEYAMECIDYIILELAKIENQKGDFDKSIEYCLMAREKAMTIAIYGSSIPDVLIDATKLLYELAEFDESDMDLFDLLFLFEKPCKARISVGDEQIIVQSIDFNGGTMIECQGKYFRNTQEFLNNYKLRGKRLAGLYKYVQDMEVLK